MENVVSWKFFSGRGRGSAAIAACWVVVRQLNNLAAGLSVEQWLAADICGFHGSLASSIADKGLMRKAAKLIQLRLMVSCLSC